MAKLGKKLRKKFNRAAKRAVNIGIGLTEVLVGAPLIVAGPVAGLALAFAGFACPILWVGAVAAFATGVAGGSALMGDGWSRVNK